MSDPPPRVARCSLAMAAPLAFVMILALPSCQVARGPGPGMYGEISAAALASELPRTDPTGDEDWPEEGGEPRRTRRGWLGTTLLWIPNRVLDVLDIVRARVRVGIGSAVDVRATDYIDVFVGSYVTAFVGLPGPRGRRFPKVFLGLESRTGVEAGPADLTLEGFSGPGYGVAEIGFGFQLYGVGLDLGIEPLEAADFVLGLFTVDIRDDDF